STIFIDASTTCAALAAELASSSIGSLTLVTNSPAIAAEFDHENVHLIVTPGEVDQNLRMIGGRWTVEVIAGLKFATCFISALGASSKYGVRAMRPVAELGELDVVVMDDGLGERERAELRGAGARLVIAGSDGARG